jgi:RNA polymerase sigma factor (sigma-70 family)
MAVCFSEDNQWFAEQLHPHEAMLRAWLRSRFASNLDLDDVIQEAYLRVLKAYKEKPIVAPKAFLFATARNIALNTVRAAAVRGENTHAKCDDFETLDSGEDIHEIIERNQELEILTLAIQTLPKRCRQIFTLYKVYGMLPREIAKELELSDTTVYNQLYIGLDKCTKFIQSHNKVHLS